MTSRAAAHPLARPTGRPNWPLAVLFGLILGSVLVIGLRTDRSEAAGRFGLGMILVALPSIPDSWRSAARTLGARTTATLVVAVAVDLVAGRPGPIAWMLIAAAGVGAFLPRVRATAPLAVLLCGLRVHQSGSAAVPGLGEGIGAVAVMAAVGVVGLATHLTARPARTADGPDRLELVTGPADRAARRRADGHHALRMMVAVAVAIGVSVAAGVGIFGGHWLITAVLLSIQRTGAATRLRLAQRLVGNTFGALLVALIMALGPTATVLAIVAATLFVVAFALRSVSYLWWAVTAPPVLLIVGDFPSAHTWYEGGIRVVLGLLGAVIVLAMFWQLPEKIYRRTRSGRCR